MVYLDYSATTPTDPRVVEAMLPYFTGDFGNASSRHGYGRRAEHAVNDARETVARVLGCRADEIIFTSGGTESDNLAVRGAAAAHRTRGTHLITSTVEHGAVGATCDALAKQGFSVTRLPVDRFGQINPTALSAAIRPETTVASLMYANNEIGSIQPVAEFGRQCRERGVLFHTDAVQAAGQLPLKVDALRCDLLSLSAHKFYGPKGIGALYVRAGTRLHAVVTGGGQESGLRPGTTPTPLIVGLAKALELAYAEFDARVSRLKELRDRLIDSVLTRIPDCQLTGHPEQRLPSHASFIIEGINGSELVDYLAADGIAASSASACKAGSLTPSSVLIALGYKPRQAVSSLRLTVGLHTTEREIATAVTSLAYCVEALRLSRSQIAV
ncbi:MAG TPA: cysteine desulfurase family protein [Aggregatilineales bacterium]|jgi:cysteine desulfurase|nr:cysteine desulfurase family protein [Aggregatilineales bacterium]